MLITDDDGTVEVPAAELAAAIAAREREAGEQPRWVWSDTAARYPELLAAGVRVERCHDLRLVDAILAGVDGRAPEPALARTVEFVRPPLPRPQADALFDFDDALLEERPAAPAAQDPATTAPETSAPATALAAAQRAESPTAHREAETAKAHRG